MCEGTIDEDVRRRFEAAWHTPTPPAIEDFLPPADHPDRQPTLEELVLVDLELSWRRRNAEAAGRRIEDYLERFPELDHTGLLPELLAEEFRVRTHHGDRPATGEYRERFPGANLDESALQALATDAPGTRPTAGSLLGRYHLEGEHARGGFGLVWRARDPQLGREVALKQLDPRRARDRHTRARFLAEARIAARLEHPGIVPVYELGDEGDEAPYYAMKLVRGRTLAQAIAEFHAGSGAGWDDSSERLRLLNAFLAVARAVAYAHRHGVIHRDLKPENIVLGDLGETIILDWGIARQRAVDEEEPARETEHAGPQSPELTCEGTLLGTPAYMSPEQAGGRPGEVDERSDVFSLGVILYQILTARRPFEGTSTGELLERLRRGVMRPPRAVDPTLPRPLEAICTRALAHAREQRYASAEQLAEDLERYLADAPVAAYRYRARERLGRWARHHRPAVAAGLVAAVLLAVAAIGGLLLVQSAERDREHRQALLRQRIIAEEAAALSELRSDRPAAAAASLERALAMLGAEEELGELRPELDRRRRDAAVLASFRLGFDEAWYRAGRDTADPAARASARRALEVLGVFAHDQWWTRLPDRDLEPGQRERLQQDAERLLLLLAILRAMPALERPGTPAAQDSARAALQVLRRERGFQRAQVSQLLDGYCRYQLGEIELAAIAPVEADNPIDHYFLGFIHFWLRSFAEDPASRFLRALAPRVPGIDLEDPLARAERHFRNAVQLEPGRYWHHFMLGWTLSAAERPLEAELAFNTCIALRPDGHLGYIGRGEELLEQHRRDPRPELLRRCMADLERARSLAPDEAQVHFARARALDARGDHRAVLEAFLAGLQLHPACFDRLMVLDRAPHSAQDERNWRGWHEYAAKHCSDPTTRVPALLVQAHLDLVLRETERARAAVDALRALEVPGGTVECIQASIHLRLEEHARALECFEGIPPEFDAEFLARAGRARSLELLEQREPARLAWQGLLPLVKGDWQRLEIERALERLSP